MAWIESHQELRNHPKTKRLARSLGITPAAAIGHLHCLWWWATDYAPDGDLTEFEDWEIADAAGYDEEDAEKFKDALIFSGFLDNTEQGTLLLHDWMDYAGKNIKQREKARERTQRYREKQAANMTARKAHETQETSGQGANGTDTPKERDGDVTHTQRTRNDDETIPCASTGQDITGHNSTGHNNTGQDINTTPITPASGGGGTDPPERPPDIQQRRFDEFWETYPKKKSKESARKAWKKIKPTQELHERILQSIRDHMARDPNWRKDNGQFIPYPASWLNAGGWEDELPKAAQTGGERNAGGSTGANQGSGFQRSTGFRRADTGADAGG